MKGSDRGPEALLKASAHLELYDIETNSEVYKHGIVTVDPVQCPAEPDAMIASVYERTKCLLKDGKFVVGVGGEHTISIGLVKATAAQFSDLSVVQFDAHADTRDEYGGSRYNHACVMARIGEICPYVQIGIRSMDMSELKKLDPNRTFFAHEVIRDPNTISRVLPGLTNNVYITIDLDVFDPSIMPSTGTPEPGGLDWYTLLNFLELVIKKKNVVGIDITELLPNPINKAPDFIAAKLIYRVLSMIFLKSEKN
jgi:agmatinase